jgi:predicted porin
MKKSLLVLAVAAAVPVLAQAQTNVTLYGRLDASVGSESRGTAAGVASGSALSLLSGVQSSNRWGVRGSEDLGGGLKAIFNIEGGFDADTGRGQSANTTQGGVSNASGGTAAGATQVNGAAAAAGLDFRRRSVVGLEGGFGSLVFGRDYDPMFRVLLASDTLGLGHYGNVHSITGGTGLAGTRAYGVRIENGIHYVSPSFGGFVVRGAYGLSEQFVASATNTKSTGRAIGLSGEFTSGPIYVGVAYRVNTVASNFNAGGVAPAAGTAIAANLQTGTDKYLAVGGRYNFGAFALNAGYNRTDVANNVLTANVGLAGGLVTGAAAANGSAPLDTKSIWVGGDAQVGPGRLHAQFGRIDPTGAGKASVIGITYNYPLSKRTNAYATFGQTKNNTSTAYSLYTSSTAVNPNGVGADPRGIAFGVGHNF